MHKQLRDKIQQQGEIAHGIGKSFQDHAERNALRNFLANCNPFQPSGETILEPHRIPHYRKTLWESTKWIWA